MSTYRRTIEYICTGCKAAGKKIMFSPYKSNNIIPATNCENCGSKLTILQFY